MPVTASTAPTSRILRISIGRREEGVIPVDILACHTTVKHIPLLNEAVEPIYGVQIVKTGIFCAGVIAVLDDAVCNPRKRMVAAQPVTKGKGSVCDMAFEYGQ